MIRFTLTSLDGTCITGTSLGDVKDWPYVPRIGEKVFIRVERDENGRILGPGEHDVQQFKVVDVRYSIHGNAILDLVWIFEK